MQANTLPLLLLVLLGLLHACDPSAQHRRAFFLWVRTMQECGHDLSGVRCMTADSFFRAVAASFKLYCNHVASHISHVYTGCHSWVLGARVSSTCFAMVYLLIWCVHRALALAVVVSVNPVPVPSV